MAEFSQPTTVTDVLLTFPGDISHLMPEWDSIPNDYRFGHTEWNKWAGDWFFSGLKKLPKPKEGIDLTVAMRHLLAIQRSFAPKHEHKEAAVAYLASLWFESPHGTH